MYARDVNREISISVLVNQPISIKKEEMVIINENKENKTIYVEISLKDIELNEIKRESYYISGENYTMLMSKSPEFSPDKPEFEYREIDLWYMIDKIRN